ncbi:regulatory protein GemA [uncultured Sulfitobacter sp.]|jgi:hypothetical protein|uniref:regulatory protein GemA n=1 Tax=uncultured Sulfitobacter sp. TaxID=191468 RepID=UPI0025994E25|nr:regulatory protein GemA [uncultured Sulfitobacter sp.]
MSISRNKLALLWVAKGKLGISDEFFREALVHIAGVTSTKDLNEGGFAAMMGYFEYCGFEPFKARGASYGERPGMASFAQIELIRTLWVEYTQGEAGEDELNIWLERTWKLSSLRFLKADVAPKVIGTLKRMKKRVA